jgi:GNAT superfamily N-acetyltransferase
MSQRELDSEISAGIVFWAHENVGEVIGVMGIQPVRDIDLSRHAYIRPGGQRRGIGASLIGHIRSLSSRQMLVGTWAAATWAIAFYQRHGFVLVSPEHKTVLLKTYWTIPERQIETSVVMANPPLTAST